MSRPSSKARQAPPQSSDSEDDDNSSDYESVVPNRSVGSSTTRSRRYVKKDDSSEDERPVPNRSVRGRDAGKYYISKNLESSDEDETRDEYSSDEDEISEEEYPYKTQNAPVVGNFVTGVDRNIVKALYGPSKEPLNLPPKSRALKFWTVKQAFEDRDLPNELLMLISQNYRGVEIPPRRAAEVYDYHGSDKLEYIAKFDVADIIAPKNTITKGSRSHEEIAIYADSDLNSLDPKTIDTKTMLIVCVEFNAFETYKAVLKQVSPFDIKPSSFHASDELLKNISLEFLEFLAESEPSNESLQRYLEARRIIGGNFRHISKISRVSRYQIFKECIKLGISLDHFKTLAVKWGISWEDVSIFVATAYYKSRSDLISYLLEDTNVFAGKHAKEVKDRIGKNIFNSRREYIPEFYETMSRESVECIYILLDKGVDLYISWYDGVRDFSSPLAQDFVREYCRRMNIITDAGEIFDKYMSHVYNQRRAISRQITGVEDAIVRLVPIAKLSPAVMRWIIKHNILDDRRHEITMRDIKFHNKNLRKYSSDVQHQLSIIRLEEDFVNHHE